MPSHSEEIWDSFDALWRQMHLLSRQVRELEARLGSLEQGGIEPFKIEGSAARPNSVYEGETSK